MNSITVNKKRVVVVGLALLVLGGCGGGSDGSDGAPGASGASGVDGFNALVLTSAEAPGIRCAGGGLRIDAGLDSNRNGQLDANEIASAQYVCNGSAGAAGTAGAAGASTLVAMVDEPAGGTCAFGGKKITAGVDTNNNGVLDASEVGSTGYVCNGAPGSAGAVGPAGANGRNTLIAMVAEPAGANCAYGGTKITSGVDTSNNGVLDPSEVTATSYLCNGPPAGLSWQNVTTTAVTAQPNRGYLANHATSRVTITLPQNSELALGDIVAVTGIGTGGWTIAQNAGQSISLSAIVQAGANWVARESNRSWVSVASSADGSRLFALESGGQIYRSADSGATWTSQTDLGVGLAVASSADGSKVVAMAGQVYTSTNGGIAWTPRGEIRNWRAVASSSDGSRLVGVVSVGQIYTSSDSGATWTARETNRAWSSVASSADGAKLVAVANFSQIYTSSDSGLTWTARESNRVWQAVASSADGSKLVAAVAGGQIYTSSDSGVTWTARETARDWRSVASSTDGSKLVAVVAGGGQIFTSSDSGVTWTARETNRNWRSVASSADGNKLVAVEFDGQIHVSSRATALGTAGSLSGDLDEAVELQYRGDGVFTVRRYVGTLTFQ